MGYRKLKLKDICHIVKGETGITKAIPGDFPMITLAEERKSHNEYQFDTKAVIIPLVSSTGHGHASMKRIHYQEGKFALGSILCALVPKQDNVYDPAYLYYILDSNKENIFVPLMKGMANVSLPMKRIKEVEINLPSLVNQKKLAKIFSSASKLNEELFTKAIFQKEGVKQLRQSILQLAVQGKLTAEWRRQNPDVEPASKLLERIRGEKKRLIKEGRIKRQKPLPEIAEEEKVFDLPEGWEWCRIGNYTYNFGQKKPDKKFSYIDVSSINNSLGKINEVQILEASKAPSRARKIVKKGAVIYSTVRPYLLNVAIIDQDYSEPIASTAFSVLMLFHGSNHYLFYCLRTKFFIDFVENQMKGMAYPAISEGNFQKGLIPLAPLPEQKAIVEKVNRLMSWCDELEKKTEERDILHEKIMQAVVRQAI